MHFSSIVLQHIDATDRPIYIHIQDGACALHWASKGGHTEVVKALLQNRADVHRVDKVTE